MGNNASIQPDLFEEDEQRASPALLPQRELAALVEALLVEIATALANRGCVDDQDLG